MPSFSRLNKHPKKRQARSRKGKSVLPHKVHSALQRLLPARQAGQREQAGPEAEPVRVGVAVSGGPDSVALLSVLVSLRSTHGLQLSVLHVNHGLRPEADQEQAGVEQLCQRWGLACVSKKLEAPPSGRGIEAWARTERYRFFQTVMEQSGLSYVALAHTMDDQAETVLFRLLRGSARRGLAGIPPIRKIGEMGEIGKIGTGQANRIGPNRWLIRPLLECSKEEVLAYLATQQLSFVIDPSNSDVRYTRNRIRHRLVPLLEEEFCAQVRPHLAQLAATLREEEDWLEEMAAIARARVQDVQDAQNVKNATSRLNVRQLAAEPAALRSRIIRQWIEQAGQSQQIGFVHLEQVRALAEGRIHGMSGVIELPGSFQVRTEHEYLILERKQVRHAAEPYAHVLTCGQQLSLPQLGWRCVLSLPQDWEGPPQKAQVSNPWMTFFDVAALSPGLSFGLAQSIIVRSVRPGDRISPLGMGGQKKIHDVFIDAKLPRSVRQVFPLIVLDSNSREIAWVPGHVRGKQALVTGTTCKVCQLEVSPLPEKAELC